MSNFANAHDFNIGVMNVDASTHVCRGEGPPRTPRELLYSKIAAGAIHDSEERCDAPTCHPETRKAVQEDIMSWMRHDDEDKSFLWLSGPAGAGKTAIAGSIAEACEAEGLLAATFFFSSSTGSENRRYKRYLVPTLAYQLAQLDGFESYEEQLLSVVQRPSVFNKHVKGQLDSLILKPMRNLCRQGTSFPSGTVIIIDGVDEIEAGHSRVMMHAEARVENEKEQEEVLGALLQASNDIGFPFRFFVVSRPERVIQEFFALKADRITHKLFLDNKYDPESDITLYFTAKFAEIRRRYGLPSSWPSKEDLQTLVETASGQFIYAATVIRFLCSTKHPDPRDRLRAILDWRSQDADALKPLDALYTRILLSSPDVALTGKWFGIIHHLGRTPALFLRLLLQDFEGQVEYLMENLASIVHSPALDDPDTAFSFYHKSFVDFLQSDRCDTTLRSAFSHSLEFYSKRYVSVFKAKSTVVPSTKAQWSLFLDSFLENMVIANSYHPPPDETSQHELTNCDVVWWVSEIITASSTQTALAAGRISYLFDISHEHCAHHLGFAYCMNSCKHWRANILRACRPLGCTLPDAVVLLRERMWYASMEMGVSRSPPGLTVDCFEIPTTDQLGSADTPREITQYTPDEDYMLLCKLADEMFQRLPDGWIEEYNVEVRRDMDRRFDALAHHLDRIQRELGMTPESNSTPKVGGSADDS
ncbi:hypothetical protein NMY22_g17204 [Coprinellus aureogranulatus]|nr:hypothetical protein NMY22_g17204 [Coprinellus aureogranulatus]